MKIQIHENYILEIDVIDSGIEGKKTLEFHQTFPKAQNPRRHRSLQLTLDAAQLQAIADYIKGS